MAQTVSFDFKNAKAMATDADIAAIKDQVVAAKATLVNKTGEGNDFLGWIDLPVDYDKEEFARIKKAAAKIQADSDVLVVIGIGGSYLGARAAIEALRHSFYNSVDKSIRKTPEIYYAGSNISSTYMALNKSLYMIHIYQIALCTSKKIMWCKFFFKFFHRDS